MIIKKEWDTKYDSHVVALFRPELCRIGKLDIGSID